MKERLETSLLSFSFYYFSFARTFDSFAIKLCYLRSYGELENGFSSTFIEQAANLKVESV
jgi:hypothetical protein